MREDLVRINYFKFHLYGVVKPILILSFSSILFQGLLLLAYEAVEGSDLIHFFLKELELYFNTSLELPRFFLTSPLSYIALGWRHPLVIILLASFVISRASSAVAEERELGYGDLLFSRPIRRWKILGIHFGVTILALLLICTLKIAGTLSILSFYPIPSPHYTLLLRMGLMSFALYSIIASYSYLFSVISPVKSKAYALAGGVTLSFFALEVMGDFWVRAKRLQSLSIFTYYQPLTILLGQEDLLKNLFALIIPSLLLLMASFFLIERGDL